MAPAAQRDEPVPMRTDAAGTQAGASAPVAAATPAATAPPAVAAAWPAWTEPHRAAVAAIEGAADAVNVRASQDAAYLELASGRWLCVWPDGALQCFAWPARWPEVTEVSLQQGAGYLRLSELGAEHSLQARVHNGALRLEHTRSWPARDPAAPADCADVPPPQRDRLDRPQRVLWPRARRSRIAVAAAAVPALAEVLRQGAQRGREAGNDVRLESFRRGAHSLTLISEWGFGEEISQQWMCVRRAGEPARCRESPRYRELVALAPERAPADSARGWLLLAGRGGARWSESVVLWLDAEGRGTELPLEKSGGDGRDCEELGRGYCVWTQGACTPYAVLAPECVRLGESVAWSAVHMRQERRWVERKREPAGASDALAAGTYRPSAEGWVPADCGALPAPPPPASPPP